MGASIKQLDNMIVIMGNDTLSKIDNQPIVVEGKDLRGTMALILFALKSNNTFIIQNVEYVFRGYSNLITKLLSLGADIIYEK